MPQSEHGHGRRRGSITGTQPGVTEPAQSDDDAQIRREARRDQKRRRQQHPFVTSLLERAAEIEANPPPPRAPARDRNEIQRAAQIAATSDPDDPVVRSRILERDRGVCQICGERIDSTDVHVDHIVPLSRGGRHVPENVQVTHSRCNIEKADAVPSDQGSTLSS